MQISSFEFFLLKLNHISISTSDFISEQHPQKIDIIKVCSQARENIFECIRFL